MRVHDFNQSGCTQDRDVWRACGQRGRRVLELASLKLPVVPGFIIDARSCSELDSYDNLDFLRPSVEKIGQLLGRRYGDTNNPLLLKLVSSSNLALSFYPSVFNVGITPSTLGGLGKIINADEDTMWFEYCYLLQSSGEKVYKIASEEFEKISSLYTGDLESRKRVVAEMRKIVGEDKLPSDAFKQLETLIRNMVKAYYDSDLDVEDNAAILVQGMVFANMDENSIVGHYRHRDIVSGKKESNGEFSRKKYTIVEGEGSPISQIDNKYLESLKNIGELVEKKFREIFQIKFIVETGVLWLVSYRKEDGKSTEADLRMRLDLYKDGEVDDKWIIEQMNPGYLSSLLYPVIDSSTISNLPKVEGGLSGSPGAAVGRVFFNAERLMDVYREANQRGEDTRLILCVRSSFAEDVKAIEIGQGVISVEGGYSSHAPVVARSMGKVAVLNQAINITGNSFELKGQIIKEGDYVSLDVPIYKEPTIYFGEARLISPNIEKNGLLELTSVAKKFVTDDFCVRANADLPRDAKIAKKMGALGIGLCRTEHMFFANDRVQSFRQMILSENKERRVQFLNHLREFQIEDFYGILKIMHPHPVTIRLLDAPLHEFLPRNDQVLNEYIAYLGKNGYEADIKHIKNRVEHLSEFNPMLGHRGCRVGVTYPEIYEMQITAIFTAACRLKKENIVTVPEILVPIIMNSHEMSLFRNGKNIAGKQIKGITQIAEDIFKKEGVSVKYLIGSMVELPVAAINSGDIAKYADFMSYGTNDLTQTTFGLSRDDATSFFPDYTEYDLLSNNPFRVLAHPVMELIKTSATRSRLTRPDIKLGLCGEHGSDPKSVAFCYESGLNYVSCSSFSVPMALLTIAQLKLKQSIGQ